LFPRNKKLSELRLNKVCGTWPVILLKLKSNKLNFEKFEKSIDTSLSDILQFLKTRVVKDVILVMNASEEELPFTISPIRKLVNWPRLERVAGSGP
jgi:hypothetical protein